jgi:RNA recognition motif-containing protein
MAPSTLFVSNFPFATTESELRSTFEALCPVKSIRIIMDRQTGRSRGFAFIEVGDEADAELAIARLNESMLSGRRLVVSHARGQAGGSTEEAPNASGVVSEPFRHRIVIEWSEDESGYTAEVPSLGVTARADSIQEAVRQVQTLTRRSAAAAGGAGD